MSDEYVPTIWQRIELGDQTVVKIAPSGMLKIEQTIGGQLEIMYLSADQAKRLVHELMHKASKTSIDTVYDGSDISFSRSMTGI
jgi:hypothetical protein